MIYAVFGDVHANLEAFDAVLADAGKCGAERYISTGDIVGYNANPVECMERLQEIGAPAVQGNHDHYAGSDERLSYFNAAARKAILWTRSQLNDRQRQSLAALPMIRQLEGFTVVHSSLAAPERWDYIFTSEEAAASLQLQSTPLCFYGHTHCPVIFRTRRGIIESMTFDTVTLESGWKYLINTGSVGQPRDRDPKAAYALYDDRTHTISLRRINYDLAATQAKIRAAGLPEIDALRLAIGR